MEARSPTGAEIFPFSEAMLTTSIGVSMPSGRRTACAATCRNWPIKAYDSRRHMFARHKPTPRTPEQRAARHDEYERYKGALLAPVDPDCIEAISVARPELVALGEPVLRAVANVYLLAALRDHRRHKDCFWLHNQELEGAFGRGKFKAVAQRHRIATVVHERSHGWTEAWKLDGRFRATCDRRACGTQPNPCASHRSGCLCRNSRGNGRFKLQRQPATRD